MADPWRFERLTLPSGLRMRVARMGRGPLMVMMHGFPESWYSWRHQLRAFGDSYECIAPEMRGYGETDAPVGIRNYTLEKLVDDIAGLIGCVGHKKAIVVGHDWGGAVGWALALTRPELLDRLVVMNCPQLAVFRRHLLGLDVGQLARSWYMLFFQLPAIPEALISANDFAALRRGILGTAVQKQAFTDADIDQIRAAFAGRRYSMTAAINYYRAAFRSFTFGPTPWLNNTISTPTLLVWGEQDRFLRKELTFGMDHLFRAPLVIRYIPDSGHWVQQEKPDLVNQYMRDFLAASPPGS
ncbi:MAG TPA: alpha/beta fold hydrolase [Candidatus Binataceae bacterium]